MLRVDCARWNQNQEILRKEAIIAQHPLTRERVMTLYEISDTYHACYDSQQDLIDAVVNFQSEINTNPLDISDRLWAKKHLESEGEKLLFSK